MKISTHTPLAGRDVQGVNAAIALGISTHTPLAGRDDRLHGAGHKGRISTHTPLAGRDGSRPQWRRSRGNFYSHAPRGARPARTAASSS